MKYAVEMKRRPHFKTCKSLGKNKYMVMGPGRIRNQDAYASEGQQKFTRPTYRSIRVEKKGLGTRNNCAGEN
jgi:hypothetical protein